MEENNVEARVSNYLSILKNEELMSAMHLDYQTINGMRLFIRDYCVQTVKQYADSKVANETVERTQAAFK